MKLFVAFLIMGVIPVSAQKVLGTQGLVNVPSADMFPKKTFVGGANFVPSDVIHFDYPVYDYFVGFTPFSFVELTFRSTLLKLKYELPSDSYCEQDRSFSIRLRPIAEDKWYPSVVVGGNDLYSYMGLSYYSAAYIVATKHFECGSAGVLGATMGYSKTLLSGDVYEGVFGGIDFCPSFYRKGRIMAEYDTNRFNLGIEALVFDHWNLFVFTNEFRGVGGGFSYQYTIKY